MYVRVTTSNISRAGKHMYWLQHDFKCDLVLISMSKVFKEKYISAYFTPNCMKKSCCYLLMICMKNRSLKAKMDKILEAHIQCFCFLSCFWAAVTKENLFKTPAIVSLENFQILVWHPRLTFDWLSVSFFDYWPIRMSDLLLPLHWINALLHWINSLLHWITWKQHLS